MNRVRRNNPLFRISAIPLIGGAVMRNFLNTIIAGFICGAVWLLYKPSEKDLANSELDLAATIERKHKALDDVECEQIHHDSLKNDLEYLENHARDRLPWHKPNETIFTIER